MIFDTKMIMERLPHRPPFLLVDRIIELDLEAGTITGLKNVTMNEPFFQGHFPGEPVMPGVLLIEAVAQAGGIFLYEKGYRGTTVLATIKEVKFRKIVRPGDTLILKAEMIHLSAKAGKMKGYILIGEEKVAEAEIMFGILPTLPEAKK